MISKSKGGGGGWDRSGTVRGSRWLWYKCIEQVITLPLVSPGVGAPGVGGLPMQHFALFVYYGNYYK